MKQRAVVTGGTGYIGAHLTKYLLNQGWEVFLISQAEFGYENVNDVLDSIHIYEYNGDILNMIDFFEKIQPDIVFHLAAAVITNYEPKQIETLVSSNILFGTEVLEAMTKCKCSLFITTGSIWQSYNGEFYNPVDLYAATKEAFEKILKFYTETFYIRAITLRLFDIYGEDDTRPKLLNLIRDIAGTEKIIDVSPAEQLLDMVHISDVVKSYLAAYELLKSNSKVKNEIFGVYTGRRMKLKDILILFSQILEIPLHVNFGGKPYKSREVMIPYEGLSKLPNWKALIEIEKGFTFFKINK